MSSRSLPDIDTQSRPELVENASANGLGAFLSVPDFKESFQKYLQHEHNLVRCPVANSCFGNGHYFVRTVGHSQIKLASEVWCVVGWRCFAPDAVRDAWGKKSVDAF